MTRALVFFPCLWMVHALSAQQPPKRAVTPEDTYRMVSVGSPRISPDAKWILYTLGKVDSARDAYEGRLHMVSVDGSETIQLTEETKTTGQPAWSPDNRYISFLSKGKGENAGSQVYLMNRKGGEPVQLTQVKGEIQAYRWYPDGRKLLLEIREQSTADTAKSKVRKPYEIDRYHFKNDSEGYLDNRRTHLYAFDLSSKKLDTLTRGRHDETGAVVSPDGKWIAYVSNTTGDPDRNSNTDIFLRSTADGRVERVTDFKGENGMPRFSPDSRRLAYNQSTTEAGFNMYEQNRLWVWDMAARQARMLSGRLDRSVDNAVWSPDGRYIYSVIDDDRNRPVIRFDAQDGAFVSVTAARGVYGNLDVAPDGTMSVLFSDSGTPNEVYVGRQDGFRRLTRATDGFLAPLRTAHVQGFECPSTEGARVHGILYLPDSSARRLPLVLFIHGGPVAQDDYGFDMARQVLAGAGYAVAAVNYRGSSGRGLAFTKSIAADWGNREVKDILAVADHLVKTGFADPGRIGIGGWSYGGILTNYAIASDGRFKAAVSGAGSSLQFSMYGSDQYILQYEEELGKPWKNPQKWMELSYPFFKVEGIATPTLFMASEDDFNVPVIGAEQMYQAFKTTGIPTELVIYPNQHHGLRVPSYIVHRYRRHIDWYGRYMK